MVIEEITDTEEISRMNAQRLQFRRNADWLESHWADLIPQAYEKFIAVAGQQAFVASTSAEAYAWARAAHPEDCGPLVEYVLPPNGPRVFANRW